MKKNAPHFPVSFRNWMICQDRLGTNVTKSSKKEGVSPTYDSLGYMLGSGKAAYAESNRLIVLYPQASVAGAWGGDCWDWAGDATGPEFDTHDGVQLGAVMRMLAGLEELVRTGEPMPKVWPPS